MLTKSKVLQLLFMMVVLVGLFFWKTFTPIDTQLVIQESQVSQQTSPVSCDYVTPCEFISEQGRFLLSVLNLPIKAEQWIDFELTLPEDNSAISKAQIVGKTMFMGRIPVSFKPSSNRKFIAKALVGACTEPQMVWSLQVTVNKDEHPELISFDFIVER